jgi:hypothetical protein
MNARGETNPTGCDLAASRRLVASLAVVAVVLCGPGCVKTYSTEKPTRDPGTGTTMSDALYRVVKPVPGEVVDAPNPDDQPLARYLGDRVYEAGRDNPSWETVRLAEPERPLEQWYGCRDGSVLILVVRLRPGPHQEPPGVDTGTQLDEVLIAR